MIHASGNFSLAAHLNWRRWRSTVLVAFLLLAGCTALKRCAYEGGNRDSWQKPEEVIQALALKPGDRVADLGSGSGYFTFRLARAVGPTGKVYAVDVDEGLNRDLAGRAKRDGYGNIEVILAEPGDPRLPESSVDLFFTSNTYHHLENRARYFTTLRSTLRPGGKVAIIDFNREGWIQSLGHYTPAEDIKREMNEAGYELEREHDFLTKQSFLVFVPRAP
jgi:ubiquinone/menaquinone biosynthesis C-methylase UbiE